MTLATLLAVVIAGAAFSIASALPSADPDIYWHLASARWMVEHGELLTRDPFSSTALGEPYSVGQWLGQLVWYAAYLADGWQGIAVLRASTVALLAFFAARVVLLVQSRPAFALLPLLAALAISKTTWTDRPQLFTQALAATFLFLLLRAHLGGGTRAVWLLPPLLLLWTNLHGGYALGLVLVGLFLAAALAERRPQARTLFAVLVLGAGASALNPEAFGALGAAGHAASPPRFIAEELPPDLFSPQGLAFGALFLAAFASALVAPGRDRLWPILLVPLIWLGLSGQRHLPLAALPLAAFVAAGVPRAIGTLWPRLAIAELRAPRVRAARAFALVLLVAIACLGPARAAPLQPDVSAYPAGALAALRAAPRELLNEYDWGGFLIWNAPEHPVFVDGRLFLYLPEVLDDWRRAVELRPSFREVLERHRIEAVLLRPSRPLAVFLRESGWRVAASEPDRYVLLVRP